MSTTKVQGDMVDIDGATVAVVATGDKFNFLDITDSLVKEDTVQGILDLVSAGGGYSFIETITASTDATITFTHTVAANFDYMVTCRFVTNTGDMATTVTPVVQVGTGGTPTFQATNYITQYMEGFGTLIRTNQGPTTAGLAFGGGENFGGASGEFWSATCELLNPGAAEETFSFQRMYGHTNDGVLNMTESRSIWDTATAITGLRVAALTSDFATGKFYLFRRAIS